MKKHMSKKALAALVLSSLYLAAPTAGFAECGVIKGATPIFEGAATAPEDITIYNDKIALSFAIGSNNYWNMTRGSILDIGVRGAGGNAFGHDMTNDSEFLMDLWTATGSYKGENLLTDVKSSYILSDAKDSVTVVNKTRFWVADADKNGVDDSQQFGQMQLPLNVTTTYTLKDGDSFVTLNTKIENPATNKVTYADMYSGYSVSTLAASMYGPFGFYPDVKTTGINIGMNENVQEPLGEFVTTYSKNYAVSVSLDKADSYKGSSGYKDVYKHQDLQPGKTYNYDGELVVSGSSETASVINRYLTRHNVQDAAVIKGRVTDVKGNPVPGAYVIVKKQGVYQQTAKAAGYTAGFEAGKVVGNMQPLAWVTTDAEGNYSFRLPKTGWQDGSANILGNGDYIYRLQVEAAGYTSLETGDINLTGDTTRDLTIQQGAHIQFNAKDADGNKVPFKVVIGGLTSEMKTLGGSVFFSDALADDPYGLDFNMSQAKGITFTATYGAGFTSKPVVLNSDITAKGKKNTFKINQMVNPKAEGWYAMDNHNHSDFGDGSTSIRDLYSIQIAEGLDMNVVADHDTRLHNQEMADFAKKDGRIFLSNIEISPGWGHWGALNVPYGPTEELKSAFLNPSVVTPKQIIDKVHELGALSIVHHPYSDYGFLNNQASVKGGNEPGWDGFDLLELQNTMNLSEMVKLTEADWQKIDRQHLKQTMPEAVTNMDARTLVSAMAFWNEGMKKYLSGGSDAHDAHSTTLYSGIVREYAHMDKYALEDYLNALISGHAYVTTGPVFLPKADSMFGSSKIADAGDELTFNMDVQAVNGMDKVYMYRNGVCIAERDLKGSDKRTPLTFTTKAAAGDNVWYSFTAVDSKGNWAATNPIWQVSKAK